MRLRAAIKIMRAVEEPWRIKGRSHPTWRHATVAKARRICERKEVSDPRIPYMPSREEIAERYRIQLSILAEAAIDDKDLLDGFLLGLWGDLGDE